MDIHARMEAILQELTEHQDRIINEMYILYALHDLPGVSRMRPAQAQSLCGGIAERCLEILCPPLAVHVVGTEVCLLIHLNVDRCVEEVALATGRVWVQQSGTADGWAEEYSAVSVGKDEMEQLADAINRGDLRVLEWFADGDEDDED